MNDFTKDELETLFTVMDDNKNDCGHDDELIDKLQSLIENYCEHEWRTSGYDALYCPKCENHVEY